MSVPYAEALAFVNEVRTMNHLKPLGAMPVGVRGNKSKCPLALALGEISPVLVSNNYIVTANERLAWDICSRVSVTAPDELEAPYIREETLSEMVGDDATWLDLSAHLKTSIDSVVYVVDELQETIVERFVDAYDYRS